MKFNVLQKWEFFWFLSIIFFNPKTLGFLFQRKIALPGSIIWKIFYLNREPSRIVNDHLEILSRPQIIGNSGQNHIFASPNRYFTDLYRKQSLIVPVNLSNLILSQETVQPQHRLKTASPDIAMFWTIVTVKRVPFVERRCKVSDWSCRVGTLLLKLINNS